MQQNSIHLHSNLRIKSSTNVFALLLKVGQPLSCSGTLMLRPVKDTTLTVQKHYFVGLFLTNVTKAENPVKLNYQVTMVAIDILAVYGKGNTGSF